MEMEMTLRKAVVEYDPRNTTVVIWKLLEKWLEILLLKQEKIQKSML